MDEEIELPRALALAWGVAAAPQRGPKREMSVERIVEAAIEIADESGLGAVSMAAVASRFEMTPMALYRYVSAKDDLVQLMFDAAMGMPPVVTGEVPWREGLAAWAQAQLEVFAAHPWLLDVPVEGPPLTPNGLAWAEAGVGSLANTPLSGSERLAAILALNGQMRWHALLRRAGATAAPEGHEHEEAAIMLALITPDGFPHYHAALFGADADADELAVGLAYVLDGIEAAIEGRATPLPAAPDPSELIGADPARKDKRYREAAKRTREREADLRNAQRDERQALREARRRLAED